MNAGRYLIPILGAGAGGVWTIHQLQRKQSNLIAENRNTTKSEVNKTMSSFNSSTDVSDGSKKITTASTGKREDYIGWSDYFMAIAFLSAQRSKDPRTQVGACIVNEEKRIVGVGYNGMPDRCSDDSMPWGRDADNILDTKKLYVCHAELNAALNRNSTSLKNCTMYVSLFPCNECAKVVIQSGIKEVIYYSDKYHDRPEFIASKRLLDTAGVKYRQYRPAEKQIVIDFTAIEEMSNGVTADKDSV